MLSHPKSFFSLRLYIRVFAGEPSQLAILQAGIDLSLLIAELLKQILRLPCALQPIREIRDCRGQISRRQQGVSALKRNRSMGVFQCALEPAPPLLEKSAQFPEI